MDYKETWQEFYDHAVEELGYDEKAAGKYADDRYYDHMADMADTWRMYEKYGEV